MSFSHWLKWFGETLRRSRESIRKPQTNQLPMTAEVLEPRSLLTSLVTEVDTDSTPPRFVVNGSQLEVHLQSESRLEVNDDENVLVIHEGDEQFEHRFSNAVEKRAIRTLLIFGASGGEYIDLTGIQPQSWSRILAIRIQAGGGDDTIFGGAIGERIDGGGGNDSIEAGSGNDTIFGGAGDDELNGGDGSDSLDAGAGDDSLIGGDGNDTLVGRTGRDFLFTTVGKDVLFGSVTSFIAVAGMTNCVLSNTGVSGIVGTGPDRVTLVNTLQGKFGAAIIVGGEENNRYDASRFTLGYVFMTGDAGSDTLIGSPGTDMLRGGEGNDLIDGGGGNDLLKGDENNDTLRGNAGDDSLLGDAGNDSLEGGPGRDSLGGGLGNDTFNDANGIFWVEDVTDVDSPDLILTTNAIVGFGTDRFLHHVNGLVLFGDERNNIIDASAYRGRVTIDGDEGDDTLIGSAFNDVIVGGVGDDSVNGANGNDVLLGDAGDDILSGERGSDTILGGDGQDSLLGGESADALLGGVGDDTLNGQAAKDTLVGGAGTNEFDVPTEVNERYSFNPAPLIVSVKLPPALKKFQSLFGEPESDE